MVDTLYIERSVLENPITDKILRHYRRSRHVYIERYGELFNIKGQNFRLQKKNPALILAKKHGKKIISTPIKYETGGDQNFYFSHMLNCIYDCRYCFLQGMYRSANYLLFVNFEDFAEDLRKHVAESLATNPWYFSGYDCDSLAFEPVTGFADYFLDVFSEKNMSKATLELRTKSTQIRSLLKRSAMENVVVAFSLNPDEVISSVEAGTPNLAKRIFAIQQLQNSGWKVGLRFDPVIWHDEFEQTYQKFFNEIFSKIDTNKIDSVTLGGVRLPKDFHKIMSNLYPEHWLFKAGMVQDETGMVSYRKEINQQILDYCQQQISRFFCSEKIYIYQ